MEYHERISLSPSSCGNRIRARDSETLCLTLNRSSQQASSYKTKAHLKGKKFSMRSRPSTFCKKNSYLLMTYKDKHLISCTYHRHPCNSWTCPDCAPKKAHFVMHLLKEVIILNQMKYFLTLTLNPNNIPHNYLYPDNHTHKYITKLFNTFLTNIRRTEKNLKYEWVIEFQKIGHAHMHIVLNTRLDISLVRQIWIRIGGGVQSKVMHIKDLISMSAYLSKYIIKDVKESNYGNLHHFERRYCISRSCIRPTFTKAKIFNPQATPQELRKEFMKQNCAWVYNKLLLDDFIDGEKVDIQ